MDVVNLLALIVSVIGLTAGAVAAFHRLFQRVTDLENEGQSLAELLRGELAELKRMLTDRGDIGPAAQPRQSQGPRPRPLGQTAAVTEALRAVAQNPAPQINASRYWIEVPFADGVKRIGPRQLAGLAEENGATGTYSYIVQTCIERLTPALDELKWNRNI